MADIRISDLTDGDPIASGDLVEIERPGDPAVSRKVTLGTLALTAKRASIQIAIDGGGSVISTGELDLSVEVPFACTIVGNRLLADQSGSIVIDIWKDTYANYPPTVADTITASAKPTLSGAIKSEDTTLSGWTTTLAKGDVLRFKVDSVATVTAVTLVLDLMKT